jgi:hypothetical protein
MDHEGIPPLAELLEPAVTAETFGAARIWVKGLAAQGQLGQAGKCVGRRHRCALLLFVKNQAAGGMRKNQASELLKMLAGSEGVWSQEASLSANELAAVVAGEEILQGLPSQTVLEDSSACTSETFWSLHDWVKQRRQAGDLADAAQLVAPMHRSSVFSFLCTLASRRTLVRSWALRLLWQLAEINAWCQDGVIDQAVAEVLADLRRVASECEEAGESAAGFDAAAVVARAGHQRSGPFPLPSEGPLGPTPTGSAALKPLPLSASQQAEAEILEGLPPRQLFESPDDDGREVFQSLRSWVRARRQAGQLAEVGALLDENSRRSIFRFLHNFTARKTIFREQARMIFQQLSDTWAVERCILCGKACEESERGPSRHQTAVVEIASRRQEAFDDLRI